MKVFIICSVRGMSEEYRSKLETYVAGLESAGHVVHLPHRDTDQTGTGVEICTQNARAIADADEVHIFYNPASQGTHFDMGVAFSWGKKLVVVENVEYEKGKSFARMITEWEARRQTVDMVMVPVRWLMEKASECKTIISSKAMNKLQFMVASKEKIQKAEEEAAMNLGKMQMISEILDLCITRTKTPE